VVERPAAHIDRNTGLAVDRELTTGRDRGGSFVGRAYPATVAVTAGAGSLALISRR
jgi:hypothetical protein